MLGYLNGINNRMPDRYSLYQVHRHHLRRLLQRRRKRKSNRIEQYLIMDTSRLPINLHTCQSNLENNKYYSCLLSSANGDAKGDTVGNPPNLLPFPFPVFNPELLCAQLYPTQNASTPATQNANAKYPR